MNDLTVTREDTGVEVKPFEGKLHEGVCDFCGQKTYAKLDEGEEAPTHMVCKTCVELGVLLVGDFKKRYKEGMMLAGINKFGEDMHLAKWVAYKVAKPLGWGVRYGDLKSDNKIVALQGTLVTEKRKIKLITRCEDAMLDYYEAKVE